VLSIPKEQCRAQCLFLRLPAELLDQIFADSSYTDRWCFALSCKAAATMATTNDSFLAVPKVKVKPTASRPGRWGRKRAAPMPILSDSKDYRDLMQALSRGWVAKDLHWCDQCRRFKPFPSRSQLEWYGDYEGRTTVEGMWKRGGWVQDITLSGEGLICWNHFCPECAQQRKSWMRPRTGNR
jgi:hypothetical protein